MNSLNVCRSPGETNETKVQSIGQYQQQTAFTALTVFLMEGQREKLKGVTIHLHNTCNIDNMMQILYSLYKIDQDTESYINQLQEDEYENAANIISVFRHMSKLHCPQ
jgi:hypothetical protein